MKSNNKRILIFVIIAIIFAGGLFSSSLLILSKDKSVKVVIDNGDLPVTVFSLSGFEMSQNETAFKLSYNDDKFLYSFVNNSGVATDFYDIRESKELVVNFMTTEEERPQLSSIEESFAGNDLKLKKLKGFEDDKWVIATSTTPDIASDGSVGVYVLESGAYKEIFSGTGPDLITLLDAGVPEPTAIKILEGYSEFN